MAGGLKVYTTLNTELYTAINDSIQKRAPESDIETAIYAMEPSTGKVLAVVGGKDYEKSTYNRAVSSSRQPGSSIKPFLDVYKRQILNHCIILKELKKQWKKRKMKFIKLM